MDRRRFLQSSLAAGMTAALPASEAYAALQALTQVSGDIRAVTGDRKEISLEQAAVQELADSLHGRVLLPGNDGYDIARRVLNASIDKHPALIVQPSVAADIQNAVTFARERNLLLAVKCGGHSYAGKSTCDHGMQIDLSTYRHCRVDPRSRTAYVAGGSLLGELDHEAMAHGLVTTAGTVSHTGVGGLTLGGGFGRLARRFGLALDNLKAVDIVTADGRLLHASADENPDLFWAVRGGGGNFGVVTSFEFHLHPMQRTVVGGEMIWPLEKAREVLRFYADFALDAPDELYCDAYMQATMTGEGNGVGLHVCYSGPESEAEKVLAPIKKLGDPVLNTVAAVDYVAIQKSWDNSDPRNTGEYLKSGFINDFPQSIADALIDGFDADPGRNTTVFFQHSGGAIGRVPVEATAFAHRKSQANMFAVVSWPLDADRTPHVDYVRSYWKELEAATDGYYTNEVASEPQAQVNKNYQGNFPRLLQVKKKYDPDNLFRLNANIAPA
ncbi:MAG TPA: FAD-binding oxidoreductase [Woeseiaceae bacterium]|nr:FAD-binding oxidoreductase [Woeseiaceae bacterium]